MRICSGLKRNLDVAVIAVIVVVVVVVVMVVVHTNVKGIAKYAACSRDRI